MNGAYAARLTSRSRRAELAGVAFASVVTFGLVALLLSIGVVHASRFGHDEFIFLDGGYRVFSGQRPHLDFHTPLGLFTPLLLGTAMRLAGPDAGAIVVAIALFVAVAAPWAYAIARARLPPLLAAAFALVVVLAAAGPYTLSFDYQETSVASLFNRLGYAVLAIQLVECLAPVGTRRTTTAQALGGLSTGAALALLFFIKPSFVAQGVVLLAMSAALFGREATRWLAVVAGAVVASVLLLVAARTSLGAVLADYAVGAAARTSSVTSNEATTLFTEMSRRDSFSMTPAKVLEILRFEAWPFAALLALALLALPPVAGVWRRAASRPGLFLATALVLASSIPIVFTNWQWGEIPTNSALALVLLDLALRERPATEAAPDAALRRAAAVSAALFVWLPFVAKNSAGVLAASSWHQTFAPRIAEANRIDADPLRQLVILRSDGYCQTPYPARINEGLALLRKQDAPLRVFVADFSNPFTFALAAPPPRGDAVWWHVGATFNLEKHPPPEEVFQDVDVFMWPRCAEETPTRDAIWAIYGKYVHARYAKADESPSWILRRRVAVAEDAAPP